MACKKVKTGCIKVHKTFLIFEAEKNIYCQLWEQEIQFYPTMHNTWFDSQVTKKVNTHLTRLFNLYVNNKIYLRTIRKSDVAKYSENKKKGCK